MPFTLPLPDVPGYALAAIPLIVLAAYTVFGATGFGTSLLGVPLLAHFFPLTFAVPLITALDAIGAPSQSYRQWRVAAWSEVRWLLPPILVGIALGTTLLVTTPREPALLALGIFITLYGAYLLAGARTLRQAPGWLALPLGVVGGVFSVLFGTGGPVYMVFLSARIHDKTALRATSSVLVAVSVLIRVVVFVVTGLLLQAPLLVTAAFMLPVMAIGLALGNRLHHRLSGSSFRRVIAALLVGNGISLIARVIPWLQAD
jgi:uncharacterized membrane protein YfcA